MTLQLPMLLPLARIGDKEKRRTPAPVGIMDDTESLLDFLVFKIKTAVTVT